MKRFIILTTIIIAICSTAMAQGIGAQRKIKDDKKREKIETNNHNTKPRPQQQKTPQRETSKIKPQQQEPVKNKTTAPEPQLPKIEMVYVSGGTFMMGADDNDAYSDEKPVNSVTLSSFQIGKYEVTQRLWKAVMGTNPSGFEGDNLPVENVSWEDAREFIRKLNAITGKNYRLPTEAEWEFAARGGNSSYGYKYSGSNNIDNVAWYYGNSGSKTHPVGTKSPNELGIYDMTGNVGEWCQDWYGSYNSGSQTNPHGPSSGSYRVFRGGGWSRDARNCRVAYRYYITPGYRFKNLGLRLAL